MNKTAKIASKKRSSFFVANRANRFIILRLIGYKINTLTYNDRSEFDECIKGA